MKVDYQRQTLETPNPIARYVHRKRYSLSIEKASALLKGGASILDFGCGKGDFLNAVADLRPDCKFFGFDPESGHGSVKKYQAITNMQEVASASIDLLCCFETLEHLYDSERSDFYCGASRVLRPFGKILVSVPIIGGVPLLAKELNRALLFKRWTDYSFTELISTSIFMIPAKRPDNWRVTHKGFDFRKIEEELKENFTMQEKIYSPFSVVGSYFNSQAFYVCEKR